ncbi:methylthioribose kinase-like isoform X2 [Littorina saxatilis]|uniref:methylthioribose kinase-like isoform X2 n=1 Tax=Littorina saxatilis TaxID=31220 RepID=UPI0038B4BECA
MECCLWQDCGLGDETVRAMVTTFCQHCKLQDGPMGSYQTDLRPKPEDVTTQRFSDSYMNHVIRIRMKRNPHSGFILKLAPPCMQCPGLTLQAPVERGENEFRALRRFQQIVDGCVPLPLFYDKASLTLCTKELSGFRSLTEEILKGGNSESGARTFGRTLSEIHSATHVLNVGHDGMQQLLEDIPTLDSMVSLIRVFHYERPFDPRDPGKRCAPEVNPLLRDLYDDVNVMATVKKVKNNFVKVKECLIHGDLHIDSVIVKDGKFKMVDLEFARVGPCAYDMGLLLATFLLLYYHHKHVPHSLDNEVKAATSFQGHCDTKNHSLQSSRLLGKNGEGEKLSYGVSGNVEDESGREVEDEKAGRPVEGLLCADREKEKEKENERAQAVANMCASVVEEYVSHIRERLHQDEAFSERMIKDIAAFAACELLSW